MNNSERLYSKVAQRSNSSEQHGARGSRTLRVQRRMCRGWMWLRGKRSGAMVDAIWESERNSEATTLRLRRWKI